MGSGVPQRGQIGTTGNIDRDPCEEEEQNDDDDDDDDDNEGYDNDSPKAVAYDRDKKRGSICAEIVQEHQDDVKEFEKTPDERMRILEILEQ